MYNRCFNEYGTGSYNCGCTICNCYRHARPKKKEMLFMDTMLIEEFIIKRIKEGEVKHCGEVCAEVAIENKALILTTNTSCLDYDVEYTLDIPRCVDWSCEQVFLRVKPCEFVRGPLELEKTIITVPYCEFPHLKLTAENLPGFYRAKFNNERKDECCEENEHRREVFVELDLDLRGNIVTTNKLFENGFKSCAGDRDRYVLYYNNAGRFVLERDRCRTKRFGDFR